MVSYLYFLATAYAIVISPLPIMADSLPCRSSPHRYDLSCQLGFFVLIELWNFLNNLIPAAVLSTLSVISIQKLALKYAIQTFFLGFALQTITMFVSAEYNPLDSWYSVLSNSLMYGLFIVAFLLIMKIKRRYGARKS